MRRTFAIAALLLAFVSLHANGSDAATKKMTSEEYVDTYYLLAIEEMMYSGIPASITLAQGILESGNGNSALATNANNHFGIKCHKGWMGDGYYMDDDEEDECFRVYAHVHDSYRDHSEFLMTRDRYSELFELEPDDYKGWAKGLKKAGYATNPKYADLLIGLVEKYELHQYDAMGPEILLAEKPQETKEPPKYIDNDLTSELVIGTEMVDMDSYSGDIFMLNFIKTVKAQPGLTPLELAIKYHVPLKRLYKYNDMEEGDLFAVGDNVFLQPKKKKGNMKYHTVKKGETMHDISQMHGIKLDKLYDRNNMPPNTQPVVGETLYLRKNRKDTPQYRTLQDVMWEKEDMKEQKKQQEKIIKENTASKEKVYESYTSAPESEIFKEEDKKEVPKNNAPVTTQPEVTPDNTKENITIVESDKVDEPVVTKPEPDEVIIVVPEDDPDPIIEESSPVEETKPETPKNAVFYYTVRAGDTLYSISKYFNTTVDKLKEWNGLQNNNLSIGQELIVGK